ncbi:Rus Holliday junction resolvase [uncultured Caudovirales phage]|uniref:Rus Holliday junction resolvase n=1 Tax=uncultured Caudovirales phage TaxID=2100421 RepID=A0A6J5LQW3_9CAUD|nr:Rus Holliday junction resolvase [uncultured Caudovirales phage]
MEAVARAAVREHGQQSGPLAVSLAFEMPTADKKRWGLPHTLRPDSDNLAKLVLDALMSAGLIGDDSAVSLLTVRKTWAASPLAGVSLTIAADQRVPLGGSQVPAWLT